MEIIDPTTLNLKPQSRTLYSIPYIVWHRPYKYRLPLWKFHEGISCTLLSANSGLLNRSGAPKIVPALWTCPFSRQRRYWFNIGRHRYALSLSLFTLAHGPFRHIVLAHSESFVLAPFLSVILRMILLDSTCERCLRSIVCYGCCYLFQG
jgi:hypothetical protein